MKIFVGQIYIKVDVNFPLSLRFQQWFGDALSARIEPSQRFTDKFGADFDLGFRISARDDISHTEIKGPTVFKRDNTVEFTIFLPHQRIDYRDPQVSLSLFDELLKSVVLVLSKLGLSTTALVADTLQLQTEFQNTPAFLDPTKPAAANPLLSSSSK
jgi:hypothetical protein